MPFTTDQAPIRNVTPMKTPIVENTLFSFCARIIWSASRSASKKVTLGGLQLVRGDHAVVQRQLLVVQGRRARWQVERVADGTYLFVPDTRQRVIRYVAHLLPRQPVVDRGGSSQAADQVHQGRLPRPRRFHDGDVFVFSD